MSINKFRLNNLGENYLIIIIFVNINYFNDKDVNYNSN